MEMTWSTRVHRKDLCDCENSAGVEWRPRHSVVSTFVGVENARSIHARAAQVNASPSQQPALVNNAQGEH